MMTNTRWAVDKDHSSVDFAIRHLMVSKVKGTFREYDAVIEADPQQFQTANLSFIVDLTSVDTRNKERDAHLLTEDFFDVEKYPQLRFITNHILKKDEYTYELVGELDFHGVTRRESFLLIFEGEATDLASNEKAGFHVEGTLKRSDYGLHFNQKLDSGGFLLGDDVHITLDIQIGKHAV